MTKVGISVGCVNSILHKHLNMHYLSQKLVPKMLSPDNKETRMNLLGDVMSMVDDNCWR